MNMGNFVKGVAKGAGLSSLLSFGGGLLDSASSLYQMKRNEKSQKEFARHGIRWRVEDAKAAGVHPLFALGGSTQGFAPNPVVPMDFGLKQAGQDVAGAVARQETNPERELRMAQLSALRSQALRDLSQSQLFDSEAARVRQQIQAGGFPGETVDPISGAIIRPQLDPQAYIEPDAALDPRGGVQNAIAAKGWTKFDFGDGPVFLFGTDPSGDQLMSDLQDMDSRTVAMIIAENKKRGTSRALMKLLDFRGKPPVHGGSKERSPRVGPGGGYLR